MVVEHAGVEVDGDREPVHSPCAARFGGHGAGERIGELIAAYRGLAGAVVTGGCREGVGEGEGDLEVVIPKAPESVRGSGGDRVDGESESPPHVLAAADPGHPGGGVVEAGEGEEGERGEEGDQGAWAGWRAAMRGLRGRAGDLHGLAGVR